MNIKKAITTLICVTAVCSMSIGTVNAAQIETPQPNKATIQIETEAGHTYTTTINLNDCHSACYDADGNLIPNTYGTITENVIHAQRTTWYWVGNGYLWDRGTKVTVKITFDRDINYEFGYEGAGYKAIVKSGKASSIKTTFTAPADGTYKIYLSNKSSEDVTVSGTVSY